DDYDLTIGSVRKSAARAQVQAIIKPDSGGRYEAVFSLARSVGGWQAQNLTLNGVNLGLTYRNQFAALMEENANNFEAALADWKREINDGLKGTAPRP
ncbi:MAG: ABC transporter substrate-binding protein, partial [Pseudomonadales bacterium]